MKQLVNPRMAQPLLQLSHTVETAATAVGLNSDTLAAMLLQIGASIISPLRTFAAVPTEAVQLLDTTLKVPGPVVEVDGAEQPGPPFAIGVLQQAAVLAPTACQEGSQVQAAAAVQAVHQGCSLHSAVRHAQCVRLAATLYSQSISARHVLPGDTLVRSEHRPWNHALHALQAGGTQRMAARYSLTADPAQKVQARRRVVKVRKGAFSLMGVRPSPV